MQMSFKVERVGNKKRVRFRNHFVINEDQNENENENENEKRYQHGSLVDVNKQSNI